MRFKLHFAITIGTMSALLNVAMAAAAWWEGAPVYPIQYSFYASPAPTTTDVRMIADGDLLRVRFVCSEARAGELKPMVREADGPVWDDDCVEIFLAPNPADPAAFYHIGFNALGTVYDAYNDHGKVEMGWSSRAEVRVERTNDAWIVEAAIPFVAFDRTPVGDLWRGDVGREWRQFIGSAATWQPLNMRFADPPRFAEINFPGVLKQPEVQKLNARLDELVVKPGLVAVREKIDALDALPGVAGSSLGARLAEERKALSVKDPALCWSAIGKVKAQLPAWRGEANELVAKALRAKLAAESKDSFAVLSSSPMLKWRPEELPWGERVRSLDLHAARGEAESAQLLVTPLHGKLDQVQVTADWNQPGIRLEVSLVGYVPVKNPTAAGFNLPGRYPDVLYPLPPSFPVAAGEAQAIWVTAWVSPDAAPGEHQGSLSISSSGEKVDLPVTVRVHQARLPERPALSTIVCTEPWQGKPYYGEEKWLEMGQATAHRSLGYRLTPDMALPWGTVFKKDVNDRWIADWNTFDAATEKWFAAGATTARVDSALLEIGGPGQGGPDVAAKLELLNRHLVEKKWNDRFYFYIFDEPAGASIPGVRKYSSFVRRHAPDIAIIGTTRFPELAGIVTTWIPVNTHLNDPTLLSFMLQRKQQGERFWTYTCFNTAGTQDADNWKIDANGVGHRALGTTLWRFGCEGYLYWAIDKWSKPGEGTQSLERLNPQLNPEVLGGCNGDGFLFYPDPNGKERPFPSVRLELTRDGFEDYELMALLRKELDTLAASPERLPGFEARLPGWQALLDTTHLVRRTDDFERDPEVYEKRHRQMLDALNELSAKP